MFEPASLNEVIDLQARSYRLLLWAKHALQSNLLNFGVMHNARAAAEAAEEWIGRHYANLPADASPKPDQLRKFASLFSSYLTTSFVLRKQPGTYLKSACGCVCTCCLYLTQADQLQVLNPDKK